MNSTVQTSLQDTIAMNLQNCQLTALIPHGPEESSGVGNPIVKQDHGQEEDRRCLKPGRPTNRQNVEARRGPRCTELGSLHSGGLTAQSQSKGDWSLSGQPESGQPSSSRAGCQLQQLRQQQRDRATKKRVRNLHSRVRQTGSAL